MREMSASSSSSQSSGIPGIPVSGVLFCAKCTFPPSAAQFYTTLPSCLHLLILFADHDRPESGGSTLLLGPAQAPLRS